MAIPEISAVVTALGTLYGALEKTSDAYGDVIKRMKGEKNAATKRKKQLEKEVRDSDERREKLKRLEKASKDLKDALARGTVNIREYQNNFTHAANQVAEFAATVGDPNLELFINHLGTQANRSATALGNLENIAGGAAESQERVTEGLVGFTGRLKHSLLSLMENWEQAFAASSAVFLTGIDDMFELVEDSRARGSSMFILASKTAAHELTMAPQQLIATFSDLRSTILRTAKDGQTLAEAERGTTDELLRQRALQDGTITSLHEFSISMNKSGEEATRFTLGLNRTLMESGVPGTLEQISEETEKAMEEFKVLQTMTGKTGAAMQEADAAFFKTATMQKQLLAIAPKDRAAKIDSLRKQRTLNLAMGLSEESFYELTQALRDQTESMSPVDQAKAMSESAVRLHALGIITGEEADKMQKLAFATRAQQIAFKESEEGLALGAKIQAGMTDNLMHGDMGDAMLAFLAQPTTDAAMGATMKAGTEMALVADINLETQKKIAASEKEQLKRKDEELSWLEKNVIGLKKLYDDYIARLFNDPTWRTAFGAVGMIGSALAGIADMAITLVGLRALLGGTGGLLSALGSIGPMILRGIVAIGAVAGPVLAVALAGAIGYGIGTLINNLPKYLGFDNELSTYINDFIFAIQDGITWLQDKFSWLTGGSEEKNTREYNEKVAELRRKQAAQDKERAKTEGAKQPPVAAQQMAQQMDIGSTEKETTAAKENIALLKQIEVELSKQGAVPTPSAWGSAAWNAAPVSPAGEGVTPPGGGDPTQTDLTLAQRTNNAETLQRLDAMADGNKAIQDLLAKLVKSADSSDINFKKQVELIEDYMMKLRGNSVMGPGRTQ